MPDPYTFPSCLLSSAKGEVFTAADAGSKADKLTLLTQACCCVVTLDGAALRIAELDLLKAQTAPLLFLPLPHRQHLMSR